MLGIVADDYESTRQLMQKGIEYDVLVTSGGVSVGQFDFVKNIQDELGVERRLWGVAMKPGKPLTFGIWNNTLVSVSRATRYRSWCVRAVCAAGTLASDGLSWACPCIGPSSLKTWWLAIAACSW